MFAVNSSREQDVSSETLLNIGEGEPTTNNNKKGKKPVNKKKKKDTAYVKEDEETVVAVEDEEMDTRDKKSESVIITADDDGDDKMVMTEDDDDWTPMEEEQRPSGSRRIRVITRPRADSGDRCPKSGSTDPYGQIRKSLIEALDSGGYGFGREKIVRYVNMTINHEQLENIICNKLMAE